MKNQEFQVIKENQIVEILEKKLSYMPQMYLWKVIHVFHVTGYVTAPFVNLENDEWRKGVHLFKLSFVNEEYRFYPDLGFKSWEEAGKSTSKTFKEGLFYWKQYLEKNCTEFFEVNLSLRDMIDFSPVYISVFYSDFGTEVKGLKDLPSTGRKKHQISCSMDSFPEAMSKFVDRDDVIQAMILVTRNRMEKGKVQFTFDSFEEREKFKLTPAEKNFVSVSFQLGENLPAKVKRTALIGRRETVLNF